MSGTLWRKILDVVEREEWPTEATITEQSKSRYEAGLDCVNSYRGSAKVLANALRQFQDCESGGYAKAGIAAILMAAAYERGDAYDADGLLAAESYLELAQKALPGRPEIEHLVAKLCLLRNRDDQARQVLDTMQRADGANFFTSSIELWYWYNQRDIEMAKSSFAVAKSLAQSAAQRELIVNQMAGCYQSFGDPADAISAYREITEVAPDDPWAWHNLSLQLLEAGNIQEADECNQKALTLMDFAAAREVAETIRQSKGVEEPIRQRKGGLWDRISGHFRST